MSWTLAALSPGTRKSSSSPSGIPSRSSLRYDDSPVSISSRTTDNVAGPIPGMSASSPERNSGSRSSVSSAMSERAAPAYARALNFCSPFTSRRAPIWERTCAAERESIPPIYEGGELGRFFDSGVEGQGLHDIFDLLLNQLELLAGAFAVEHSVSHRHCDAIHVLDLGDDLFGRATKADVASLVGESAVAASLEILRSELPGYFDRFSDCPAGNGAVIRDSHLVARRIAEPQPANVFHAIVGETERDLVFLAVDRDRADRVLCDAGVRCHGRVSASYGRSGFIKEWVECREKLFRLFNVRHMAALVQNHEVRCERTGACSE